MSVKNVFKKGIKRVESRMLSWDLRLLTKRFLLFGVLIALVGSYMWYSKLYMTEERKFWIAMENSMATKSVTRSILSGGTGDQVVQSQRFYFSPQNGSMSKVEFNQKSATVETSVVTEGVTIPGSQFSRYTHFSTNQKNDDGRTPNLDSILGKWEGNVTSEINDPQALQNYVGELVSLVIFGNFDANFRKDVINIMKDNKIYDVNFDTITENDVDGEKILSYSATVHLQPYVEQLQRAFIKAGYGEFPPLNPENYRPDSKLPVQIFVNNRNNTIVGVHYGERQENYLDYGINSTLQIPEAEFKSGELEKKVQEEIQEIL